jgi:hypothetical protein
VVVLAYDPEARLASADGATAQAKSGALTSPCGHMSEPWRHLKTVATWSS